MRTPGPATRATLAVLQIAARPFDAFGAGFVFLRGLDPANPFITCKGRDIQPCGQRSRMRCQHFLEISGQGMDSTGGDFCGRHSSIKYHDAQKSQIKKGRSAAALFLFYNRQCVDIDFGTFHEVLFNLAHDHQFSFFIHRDVGEIFGVDINADFAG